MAVILDIPMPGGCRVCPLNEDDWGCIITGLPVMADTRPESCPLYDVVHVDPVDIGIDLTRDLSWTGQVILNEEVRKKLLPPRTAPGSGPSGSGESHGNKWADGAAARKEVT